jgi:hypothetical protein
VVTLGPTAQITFIKFLNSRINKSSSLYEMATSYRCEKLIIASFLFLIFTVLKKTDSLRCARSMGRHGIRTANALTAVRREDNFRFNFALQLSGESDDNQNSRKPNAIRNLNIAEEEEGEARFLIKEIEGENNTKTGQFIFSKKNGKDTTPIFAFSTPPAPLSDSLIVVGATVGGLFGLVLAFLLSNKDIVPFPSH